MVWRKMKTQSELSVITKAKDLCSYVMTITQRSPKHFRYTFVSRMQNLCLDIIEHLYRANMIFVSKNDPDACGKRLEFQHQTLTELKLLGYFALLAMEQKCILPKQYEQIARLSSDCQNMLGAWINSDKKRL